MSARFDLLDTPLSGLRVLQRKPIGDSRGYLERLFCRNELQELAPGKPIAQINHTWTATHLLVVLRALPDAPVRTGGRKALSLQNHWHLSPIFSFTQELDELGWVFGKNHQPIAAYAVLLAGPQYFPVKQEDAP